MLTNTGACPSIRLSRIVTVSVETMKIVDGLPPLGIID
jgi:hypothetical protein